MASDAAKEAAIKNRIITHMNSDHQDSLIRYLEHFCRLSSFSARNARLVDITYTDLTIETSLHRRHKVPVKPSMTAWSDARPRVVAMDHEAVAGLNVSSVTVKTYKRPVGFLLVVFVASILTVAIFPRRANFEAGSLLYDHLLRYLPGAADFCLKIRPLLLSVLLILHGSEAIWFARTRLARHTVPTGTRLWWMWMGSVFIEGVGAFMRFDQLVKDEETRKAKAQH